MEKTNCYDVVYNWFQILKRKPLHDAARLHKKHFGDRSLGDYTQRFFVEDFIIKSLQRFF